MHKDIEKILISQKDIENKCQELGAQISKDYMNTEGKLLVICLLNGSIPFMAQLIKNISIQIEYDCIAVSSYCGINSEQVNISRDVRIDVKHRNVLLVEDIVDTGNTLNCVKNLYLKKDVASIKIVSLLNKPSRRKEHVEIDYCGFEIEDRFVVGFGLDYNQSYRNLPFIGILKKEVYQ